MNPINPTIFRAYDIRGKVDGQITTDAALLIGKGFGSVLRERTKKDHPIVCVGRDARTHSPALEESLIEGLRSTGCSIIKIGETPSPVNYFTICTRELDGGVQVTASHNPPSDNGFKLQLADAEPYSGEDLQDLLKRIQTESFVSGTGDVNDFDAITPYIDYLSKMFAGKGEGISVVIDCGNGVTGPSYTKALRAIGCDVTELFTEPDGTFPNHAADPSKYDTLNSLRALVKEKKSHIGLAYDGDGDRVGIVDEKGDIKTADELLLLLAQDHLTRFAHAPIVFTVSNSGALHTEITKWGGVPVIAKVGHSFVEHAMREHNAMLGGEQSGHFFCGEDYFSFDDALVASMRILSILKESGKSFSQLFEAFPKVYQAPEKRPYCPDEKKSEIIEKITEYFSQSYPVETLDGARIDFGEGAWAGIRQSNTSPCLSICLEARSPEKLDEIEKKVLLHLGEYAEIDFNR